MTSRVQFLESVSGIQYPEMIVDFFDHFVALKQIVQDSGKVEVLNFDKNSICFSIKFVIFRLKYFIGMRRHVIIYWMRIK